LICTANQGLKSDDWLKRQGAHKTIEGGTMTQDECDHLDARVHQAFRDAAVFSFLSPSHLLAAFPEARSLFDEIVGKGGARTGPYRVVLVQTSEFPDGKMFLRGPDKPHDSSCIIIASNRERYDAQRLKIQRILGRKSHAGRQLDEMI